MEEQLRSEKILFKKPSLKRDDFISVLDAMIDERIYPGIIYKIFKEEITKITGINNILILPSKWVALKIVFDYLYSEYQTIKNLIITNNSDPFYYEFFKNYKVNILPVDINKDFLPDIKNIFNLKLEVNDLLFISFNTGFSVDFNDINSIDVVQLADLSGSFFTFYNNLHIGKNFDFVFFSLKDDDIITTGDGAILYIKSKKIYNKIEKIVDEYNLKLSDFNCALGLSQLRKINKIINSRKKIVEYYLQNIKDSVKILYYRNIDFNKLKGNIPNFNNFYILIDKNLNYYKELFYSNNVIVKPIIEKPISLYLNKGIEQYEFSGIYAKQGLNIPVYPTLKEEQLKLIVKIINKID